MLHMKALQVSLKSKEYKIKISPLFRFIGEGGILCTLWCKKNIFDLVIQDELRRSCIFGLVFFLNVAKGNYIAILSFSC